MPFFRESIYISLQLECKRAILIMQHKTKLNTATIGVGKSTIVKRVCDMLRQRATALDVRGFYTEEVRQEGERTGFDVIDLKDTSRRAPLARLSK